MKPNLPKHYRSTDQICAIRRCVFCLLKSFIFKSPPDFQAEKTVECQLKVADIAHGPYYAFGFDLGTLSDGRTIIQIDNHWFALPKFCKTVKILYYGSCCSKTESLKLNMKSDAKIIYTYGGWERTDVMEVRQRYEGELGKGVFALVDIPEHTVLGMYPGEFISRKQANELGRNKEIGERYLFEYNGTFIDASEVSDKIINMMNDRPKTTANCKATSINNYPRPFLVTRRNIIGGEELEFDYGGRSSDYEWRQNPEQYSTHSALEIKNTSGTVANKKNRREYRTGSNFAYKPKFGNFAGGKVPNIRDRKKFSEALLNSISADLLQPRPDWSLTKKKRSARGCSKNAKFLCEDCHGMYTNLFRHSCKGLAPDGGKIASRGIRFCPLCPPYLGLLMALPKHLRDQHGLTSTASLTISKLYKQTLVRYNAGKLQLSGEWEQFSEGVEGSASVPEKIEKCGEKDDEEEDCEEDTQYEDYEVLQDNICSSATAFKAEENEKDGEEEDREDQEYDDDKA